MVKLLPSDVQTKEVLEWEGLHLFHADVSSCSQKTRIFLNLKGIDWQSHLVDLPGGQNHTPWYLGINPRGLVPVLVHNGDVHIESNDILLYLEETFPDPKLLPEDISAQGKALLDLEDEMHMDLRTLTFRYVKPPSPGPMKNPEELAVLAAHKGTVAGQADGQAEKEIAFWQAANENDGITDAQVKASTEKFASAFKKIDQALADKAYILGETLSVADIAWFIYANRVRLAGYPLSQHPQLYKWFNALLVQPAFAKEIAMPPGAEEAIKRGHDEQTKHGKGLMQVASECFV
ncbi:MAG: hypothetical protein Hens3KO_06790 [Henriciella sp.]